MLLALILIMATATQPVTQPSGKVLFEEKFANLDLHIGQLRKMRDRLKSLIKRSRAGNGRGPCPIIRALDGEAEA